MPTVLVTGGSGTLGTAVVATLQERGYDVTAPTREEADLFDPAAVRAVVDRAVPLRGLVNLVGGFVSGQPVAGTPIEAFEAQLRLNLRPTYLVTQAALPHLHDGGAIVNVSSRAALRPFAGAAGYCASKAAVIAFTQVVAAEGREVGVRCNAILPSVIGDAPRQVPPAQIAAVIAHLLGDDAAATSGAAIPVYGGG